MSTASGEHQPNDNDTTNTSIRHRFSISHLLGHLTTPYGDLIYPAITLHDR